MLQLVANRRPTARTGLCPARNHRCRWFMLVLASLLGLAGCASHTKVVDEWRNQHPSADKPEKVAVIAVLPDALLRESVEKDVVAQLQKKGHNAVISGDIKGMRGGIRGAIDPEPAVKALRAAGVDGVIVMFYVGGVSETYQRADYWAQYEGTAVGFAGYNWGAPYFVDVYSIHQGPGFADISENALVESTYYDLDAREPVWRIVTRTKDIRNTDGLREITGKIASEMKAAGL